MTQPTTAEDVRTAQEHEYGQFIAAEAIDIAGARAFNPGDAVPASHVERGVVREDQVTAVGTAAADKKKG